MKAAEEFSTTVPATQIADLQRRFGIFRREPVSVRDRLRMNGSTPRWLRFIAAIISCLLHMGLIVFLWLLPDDRTALQVNRDAQAREYPNEEQLTAVFFIPDDNPHPRNKAPLQSALDAPMTLSTIEPDVTPAEPTLSVEDMGEMTSAERDRVALATSRVAYLSQIQARIERTWDHPLVSLDQAFHCQVKIQQTLQGELKALTISDCDGDEAWQQSLLRAVRNAAPFPAPRDEKSFVQELTLDFTTEAVSLTALFTLLETLPGNATTPIVQGRP